MIDRAMRVLLAMMAGMTIGCAGPADQTNLPAPLTREDGLKVMVSPENIQPELRVVLPGHPDSDAAADILFPEQVTVRGPSASEVQRLYVFRPGSTGERPRWRRNGTFLEYERDLPRSIHMLARATLDYDGIEIRYEFTNRSDVDYQVYAVTDPRMKSIFHDIRLERTYVHHASGFELLASETPGRLTMPLDQWLPSRYIASHTWPVPHKLVDRRDDGITYYYKSRPVDEAFIATLSTDHQWVFGTYAGETGNVWSNPEHTCQHVDPRAPLLAHYSMLVYVKVLIIHGSLEEAQRVFMKSGAVY